MFRGVFLSLNYYFNACIQEYSQYLIVAHIISNKCMKIIIKAELVRVASVSRSTISKVANGPLNPT